MGLSAGLLGHADSAARALLYGEAARGPGPSVRLARRPGSSNGAPPLSGAGERSRGVPPPACTDRRDPRTACQPLLPTMGWWGPSPIEVGADYSSASKRPVCPALLAQPRD